MIKKTRNFNKNFKTSLSAEKAPINTKFPKVKDNYIQFPANSVEPFDVTDFFNVHSMPSFNVNHQDLSCNERLKIKATLEHLAADLHLNIKDVNLLDTFYWFTVNNHCITAFNSVDHNRLIKKSYTCLVNYRIFMLLCKIISSINVNDQLKINEYLKITNGLFTKRNSSTFFTLNYSGKGDYDPRVKTAFVNTNNNLTFFLGEIYKNISKIELMLTSIIVKNPLLKDISFETFKNRLLFTNVLTFSHSPDTKTTNVFCTNLDVLSHMMYFPFNSTFLVKKKDQLIIIQRLRNNFELLFKIYFYYCIIQKSDQLLVPLNILFPLQNTSKSLKMSFKDLKELYTKESISNNMFSELTKLFSTTSFNLSTFLALNLNIQSFSDSYKNLNIDNLKSNFDVLEKRLTLQQQRANDINVILTRK